jgi:flagellar biogenesis protein FliO
MRRLLFGGVMALTLGVTSSALADEPAAPTPATAKPAAAVAYPAKEAASPTAPTPPTVKVPDAVVAAPVKPVEAVVPAPVKAAAPLVAPPSPPAKEAPAAVVAPPKEATPVAAMPAAAPSKEAELPLALRPASPLTLAAEPASTPWIYKLAFGAAILAAGFILWKRRRTHGTKRAPGNAIRVLGKTAMGLRGELALVEVGGMRLVVGITPSSMQTLAILPDDYDVAAESAADAEAEPVSDTRRSSAPIVPTKSDFATRARSLFSSLDIGPPIPARASRTSAFSASRYADERDGEDAPESAPAPSPKARPRQEDDRDDERRRRTPSREVPLEGQARGIALALRNRK